MELHCVAFPVLEEDYFAMIYRWNVLNHCYWVTQYVSAMSTFVLSPQGMEFKKKTFEES